MVDTNSEEVTFDQIDALARALFHKADATNVWTALDHPTQLYWRVKANKLLLDMGPTFPTQNFSDMESRHRK